MSIVGETVRSPEHMASWRLSIGAAWVPRWRYFWALLAGAVGVISMSGTIPGARSTVSLRILPVAMTWLLAAGITAIGPTVPTAMAHLP